MPRRGGVVVAVRVEVVVVRAEERIHHVDQRLVGLTVGEDLGGAPVEGAGEIQVIVDGRVAARGDEHLSSGNNGEQSTNGNRISTEGTSRDVAEM